LSGDDSSSHSLPSIASIQFIDSALSFEACLYHQVLALEGDRVVLGMVNPEDTAAIEYVERILSYMNYSLVPQPMALEAHKALLQKLNVFIKKNACYYACGRSQELKANRLLCRY